MEHKQIAKQSHDVMKDNPKPMTTQQQIAMKVQDAMTNPQFEKLQFTQRRPDGHYQALQFFTNGYGVSVVFGPHNYSDNGTFEMAVIRKNPDREQGWEITYQTPTTSDVIAYATPEKITAYMQEIVLYSKNQYEENPHNHNAE
jgi:hypothetical protein